MNQGYKKCDKIFNFPGILDYHPSISMYGLVGEVGSLSSLGCMSKFSEGNFFFFFQKKKKFPYLFFLIYCAYDVEYLQRLGRLSVLKV
jgi:hypothetical protein